MTHASGPDEQRRHGRPPGYRGAIDLTLHVVFFASTVLFLSLLVPFHPYPGSFALKALPALSLALLVLRNVAGAQGKLLFGGLLLSAAGDVILDIDRTGLFVPGLAAFLLAHVLYIAAFLRERAFSPARIAPLVLLAIYAGVLAWLLRDVPGDKIVPVMAYLVVITAMAMSSLLMRRGHPLIIVGALVFVASDTIIAINRFLAPIPNSMLYNIGVYFCAQYLIVAGFLVSQRGASRTRR
jgi:uncharacterized membrane protein YhhN